MADDDTPQGTVPTTPESTPVPPQPPGDVDEMLDQFLDDPEADTDEEEAEEEPTDADDQAEPEDGEQPRDDKGRFLPDDAKVRLDDGTVVTLKDLKQGSLRQADYTRKTQELARNREAWEQRNRAVEQLENQLTQERNWALLVLNQSLPQPPDPADVEKNPIGYLQAKADYDQQMERYNALYAQTVEALNRQSTAQQQTLQETFREGQKRLRTELVPELRDNAKFDAFVSDVARFGSEAYGFSDEELAQVVDPRHFAVLHDAIKYRKLVAQKPQAALKTQGRPPVTPGRRQEPQAQIARNEAKARQTLKATGGRGRDGEAALDRLLDKFV